MLEFDQALIVAQKYALTLQYVQNPPAMWTPLFMNPCKPSHFTL